MRPDSSREAAAAAAYQSSRDGRPSFVLNSLLQLPQSFSCGFVGCDSDTRAKPTLAEVTFFLAFETVLESEELVGCLFEVQVYQGGIVNTNK